MLEHESRAEAIDQRSPFVIRGHHLKHFASELARKQIEDSVHAKLSLFQRLTRRISLRKEKRFTISLGNIGKILLDAYMEEPDSPSKQKIITYLHDRLGFTIEDGDRVDELNKKVNETFLALEDDYPTEIVEGMPDAICETCAIGEHCRRLDISAFNSTTNTLKEEKPYVDAFLEETNILKLPKPTITEEDAHFLDAEPQRARRIKTTMAVVREALKQTKSPLLKNENKS